MAGVEDQLEDMADVAWALPVSLSVRHSPNPRSSLALFSGVSHTDVSVLVTSIPTHMLHLVSSVWFWFFPPDHASVSAAQARVEFALGAPTLRFNPNFNPNFRLFPSVNMYGCSPLDLLGMYGAWILRVIHADSFVSLAWLFAQMALVMVVVVPFYLTLSLLPRPAYPRDPAQEDWRYRGRARAVPTDSVQS
jgi:hypothetical protein